SWLTRELKRTNGLVGRHESQKRDGTYTESPERRPDGEVRVGGFNRVFKINIQKSLVPVECLVVRHLRFVEMLEELIIGRYGAIRLNNSSYCGNRGVGKPGLFLIQLDIVGDP